MSTSVFSYIMIGFMFLSSMLLPETVTAEQKTADEITVPTASDLSQLAAQSSRRKVPILLMFSAKDCDYCQQLEADVIRPMMLSGDFDRRAIFRKVDIDGSKPLKDFNGAKLNAQALAYQRHIKVTPTLVFVDSQGKELAPKVVGYQTNVFYNAYLDQAIDVSQELLHERKTSTQ